MKRIASSGSNSKPISNHYHPRTREAAGLLSFLGNILLGMSGPLRCRFQGHDPEPFYKEGIYSIHTHRCSRCHATLGMGRMNWYSMLPDPESEITPEEWRNFINKFASPESIQDFTAYTPKEYEKICQQRIEHRQWLIRSMKSLSTLLVSRMI